MKLKFLSFGQIKIELSLSALSDALLTKLFELTQPNRLFTRIENFNFTKFDGKVTNNHLVNIVLLRCVYSETKKAGNNAEGKRILDLMYKHYVRFF